MPASAGAVLANAGHDVQTAGDEGLLGATDPSIIAACAGEARALVTLDLDFADIRAYPPFEHNGLVVLRLPRQDAPSIRAALQQCLAHFETEPLLGRLWIVESSRIRIRGEEHA